MQIYTIATGINNKNVSFSGSRESLYSAGSNEKKPDDRDYGSLPADTNGYMPGYFGKGLRVLPKITSDSMSPKINEQINILRLNKLFLSSGNRRSDLAECRELIKRLAKLDFETVASKYLYCMQNTDNTDIISKNPKFSADILELEDLTIKGLKSLHEMAEIIYQKDHQWHSLPGVLYIMDLNARNYKKYNDFDIIPTSRQISFINSFLFYIDDDYVNNLDENNALMNISLIRDIKNCGSAKKLQEKLIERMKNKPIYSIGVDNDKLIDFVQNDIFSYENLVSTIGKMDLSKYKKGLPLKYPRKDFISDFKKEADKLSPQEQNQLYKYYKFNIDAQNDIIKYPVPNNSEVFEYPKNVQTAIEKTREYVNNFMLNNSYVLDEEDAGAEYLLNKFIQVFPEFISVTGKMEHRGDSIDFHTLDDLKLCLASPEIQSLAKEEQRILFLSVMFHDISKKENMIDKGHQRPSALYAKEIIKKLPVSLDEKERIYNLILNSHWTTEGKSDKDLGAVFRHGNDFKMAQILAEADTYSAGFKYAPDYRLLRNTQNNIKTIKSNGIPLFADNLPIDKSKFPKNDEGIMYLDFTDKELDLTRYGFPDGTCVKNLNMLCHSSSRSLEHLLNICDDSKEICLSSSLLNGNSSLRTFYNNGCNVILHACNSDIALGGIMVGGTGGKRGFDEYKDYIYMENNCKNHDEYDKSRYEKYRQEIPNFLKQELKLSDEEYYEFYNQIEFFKSKKDIKRITLSSGRILHSYNIKKAINKVQAVLVSNESGKDYENEVVIFQPKIEASVMSKQEFLNTSIKNNQTKQTAKKNNIPIILV